MNIDLLNSVKQGEGDPLAQLQQMFSSTLDGEAESPLDFINQGAFSQIDLEIPVGYGITIVIHLPQSLLDESTSEVELFILDKLLNKGGAVYMSIEWVEFGLVDVMVYASSRAGMALFIKLANGGAVSGAMMDVIAKVANTLVSKASTGGVDVNILEWGRIEEFFNRVYYSGLLRTSKDNRYSGFKVKL